MQATGFDEAGGRFVVAVLVGLVFMSSQPVSAQQTETTPAEALQSRVEFALSAYHGMPTRDELDAIGSSAAVANTLRHLAQSVATRPSMRLRAVDMLGHYGDAVTVAFLEKIVQAPASLEVHRSRHAELLRHHAVTSFARIRGEEAVEKLAPLVLHGELQLRLTVVSALGRFGGHAGRMRLQMLRSQIEQPVVLRHLNRSIAHSGKD